MKIEHFPAAIAAAIPVLEQINAAGFEAYFVGGCVRDMLLQRPIHDVDLATSAYPAEIKAIFNHTADTGIDHGTVTVITTHQTYEITTFRTESGYQDYRRPDHVEFVRSLKQDLKRRDFTINALAMTTQGQIIDLFGGVTDLQNHRIKAVGNPQERFHEDALRMLRAVRFQAQLDFTIDPATQRGIAANADLLSKIAVERIRDEWLKLMQAPCWQAGLKTMLQTQLNRYCPQLADAQVSELLTLDAQLNLQNQTQVWTLLGWQWQLHKAQLLQFLKAWKLANAVIKVTMKSVQLLQQLPQITTWDVYQAQEAVIQNCCQLLSLLNRNDQAQQLAAVYQQLPIKSSHDLAVDGQWLMQELQLQPGPQIGQDLLWIQQRIVSRQLANQQSEILKALRQRDAQIKGD